MKRSWKPTWMLPLFEAGSSVGVGAGVFVVLQSDVVLYQ
jgi:hypothetical protein